MRRRMRKVWGAALALALACSVCAVPAYAEVGGPETGSGDGGTTVGDTAGGDTDATGSTEGYGYKVRVFAGGKGVFAGGGSYAQYDTTTTLSADSFTVEEGYFAKGLRRSGRDRSEIDGAVTWQAAVDGDVDYVVSYGIAQNVVTYTVRYVYVNEAGEETELERDTFYANLGDKPVVAYRYIEGYTPLVEAITGTVEYDGIVFDFPYKIAGGVQVVDETVTDYGVTYEDLPATVTDDGTTYVGGGGAGGAGGAGDAGAGGVDIGDNDTPQGVLDLDDNDTPLGDLQLDMDSQSGKRVGLFGAIAGAAVAVGGLGWLLWFLLIGRKRREEDKD